MDNTVKERRGDLCVGKNVVPAGKFKVSRDNYAPLFVAF